PSPSADAESVKELADEIVLRLRRHGITGRERLVLVDRGDGVGAMPAAQLAELAGHPRVSVLLGGMAAWEGELATGPVELTPARPGAPRSSRTVTPARDPRSRRSRCAARATTHATTPGRGTSGRATPSCRSSASGRTPAAPPSAARLELSRSLEHACGGVEERRAQGAPELVPRADVCARLFAQTFGIGRR